MKPVKSKSKSIVYPQVNTKVWSDQYNLGRNSIPCANCGVLQLLTIPFATGSWRGLLAPLHECGPTYQSSCAIQLNEKPGEGWADIYKAALRAKGVKA